MVVTMNSTVDSQHPATSARQQQILDFGTSWFALGGGSSQQIDERFGMSDRDFFTELDRLVADSPPTSLTKGELRRMRDVIRRRLWMAR